MCIRDRCYTCGEKGHVAKKCKKPVNGKQKKKADDVLALEDVCYVPPEDSDSEAEVPAPWIPANDAMTLEDFCYAPQYSDSEIEAPAPWLTEVRPVSESDSSSDSDDDRECMPRQQQARDMAKLYPWLNVEAMTQQPQLVPVGFPGRVETPGPADWPPHPSSLAPLASPGNQPCLLYTSPSPRDRQKSRMPSSA